MVKGKYIYFRSLQIDDALISVTWRNDPKIWESTIRGSMPIVTLEMEEEWIESVIEEMKPEDDKGFPLSVRFAICCVKDDKYIGNIYLTNIDRDDKSAEFHIFIGDKDYWGKGIGSLATKLMLQYGFDNLNLDFIHLKVKQNNKPAIKIYTKFGFEEISVKDGIKKMKKVK